ncbi:MAG: hypothetical protein D6731_13495, partial [Planctomycetota bacterium]
PKKAGAKKATPKKAGAKKATPKKAGAKKATPKKAEGRPPDRKPSTKRTGASASSRPGAQAPRRRAAPVPAGTSARMARKARESVHAISSEKTLEQIYAGETMERVAEAGRMQRLADLDFDAQPPAELRRCGRDPFASFRTELQRPEDELLDPHATWRLQNGRLRHEMNPGASPETIAAVEQHLRTPLPPSYHDFVLEWNGGLLYVHEAGAYRVLPVDRLLEEVKGPLEGWIRYPHLPVVDLGCGDYLVFDVSKTGRGQEYPLLWWYAGKVERRIAENFGSWLRRLVEARGEAYWWEV